MLLASYQHFVFKGLMNSRTKKEDCIIIHTYNIKESEAIIHTSIEYIMLVSFAVLQHFQKWRKKQKKVLTQSSKNSFPISPNHKINGTHNKRDIQKREIITNRERDRDPQIREKLRNSHTQNWLLLCRNKSKS